MGLFSKSDIEIKLQKTYVPFFQEMMGMSSLRAKKHFRDMFKLAKEYSETDGGSNIPLNYGDICLKKESTNEKIKSKLMKLRKEGVRDEDIRGWWNMHDLERKMIIIASENSILAHSILFLEAGYSPEEASKRARGFRPVFDNPNDTTKATGKDRPLPIELSNRIHIYVQKRTKTNPEQFEKDIEKSSTFNALIREEIEKGNI